MSDHLGFVIAVLAVALPLAAFFEMCERAREREQWRKIIAEIEKHCGVRHE